MLKSLHAGALALIAVVCAPAAAMAACPTAPTYTSLTGQDAATTTRTMQTVTSAGSGNQLPTPVVHGNDGTTTPKALALDSNCNLLTSNPLTQVTVNGVLGLRSFIYDSTGTLVDWSTTPALSAGTAIIGKVGIDQTTDGTTNAVHLVAGTALAGKFGIDQTTDGTTNAVHLVAGTAIAGKVGFDPANNTVQSVAGTIGGMSSTSFEVAASDNHQVIKNGAGTMYGVDAWSKHTQALFMRFYDAGTGFNGCNSATGLIWEGQIPANGTPANGAGMIRPFGDIGRAFSSGLSVCVTGAYGNTDTTSATASVASVNIGWK